MQILSVLGSMSNVLVEEKDRGRINPNNERDAEDEAGIEAEEKIQTKII